jgi:hypothetical protein
MFGTWISSLFLALLLPDPAALLQRADEVDRQHEELRRRYVYRELQTNWNNWEGTGKSRSGLYENLFVEGLRYRKRLERNGKPLSAKEQKAIEEAMKKTAAERRAERRQPKKGGFFNRVYNVRYGSVGEVAKVSDCTVTGEEAGNWVVRCEPKAQLAGATKQEEELLCYRQTFWIDQKESAVARRRIEVVREGAELKPPSVIDGRMTKEADGPWMVREMELRFRVRTGKGYQTHVFTDYKRFAVESTITVEAEPGVPQDRP